MSVIVPTWQRRDLVRRALESVFAQTYRDFETIVVDDGSTDGTREALEPLGERITYLWQENGGPSAARNAGIAIARGELFAFLDSDDLWLPSHLETTVAAIDRHPRAVLATTASGPLATYEPGRIELTDPLPRLLADNFVRWIHAAVVRREAVSAIGGFDERIRAGEHHDLFLRLALRGPFVTVGERTAVRRAAPNSLHEDARTRGDYLTGFELATDALARHIAADAGRADLVPAAYGRVEFARALRALREGDDAGARASLARACELYPRFSAEPEWVNGRLRQVSATVDRAARLRQLAAAASLWPDPRADSALYMRAHAIGLALRTGRLGLAAALLRRWPATATPGFARRRRRLVVRRVRQPVYAARNRIRGPAAA